MAWRYALRGCPGDGCHRRGKRGAPGVAPTGSTNHPNNRHGGNDAHLGHRMGAKVSDVWSCGKRFFLVFRGAVSKYKSTSACLLGVGEATQELSEYMKPRTSLGQVAREATHYGHETILRRYCQVNDFSFIPGRLQHGWRRDDGFGPLTVPKNSLASCGREGTWSKVEQGECRVLCRSEHLSFTSSKWNRIC